MSAILRNLRKMQHRQPRAQLSMFCRGRSIGRNELFAYTNGHFLVDEQRQLNRPAGDEISRIATIEKMEGGFSKALLMKKENEDEVIAKISCRIAGPTHLTTASEVGVLQYVRNNTSIPAPRVLSWSSDSANPDGAEYIIMEKAAGVPLFQRWADMAEIEKLELIKNLTKLEAQLSSVQFPAYGGLYPRADACVQNFHTRILDDSIDPSHSFCIGPSCERSFHIDPATDAQSKGNFDQGPWNTISDFGISIAKRELSRISSKRSVGAFTFYRGNSRPAIINSGQPTLWQTDLYMGNIYVAANESSRIVSIIDFQSISVLPRFLQTQWPIFLKPPHNYTKSFVQPTLPDGFDRLDEESKSLAKACEVSTYLENRVAQDAMSVPRVFRELFIRCGEVPEVGVISLRACLIEIFQNWVSLGFTTRCPFSFEEGEINTHQHQFKEYEAWHEVQHLACEYLDTDAEGWVAPQLDITEKQRQNRELLSIFIQRMDGEIPLDEARKMWPFLDEA
ncbi:hypothetical protein BDV59DRAFT_192098 [Aspergillus ambiguus]|uniref:uncharacterized protein n=1 Tax=Aspergillus ambiguus TaxID=176160 RepID=UPI003CCDD802